MNGIESLDREFISAILECREPNTCGAKALPCYRTPIMLEQQLQST